jgi:hypothetical protein
MEVLQASQLLRRSIILGWTLPVFNRNGRILLVDPARSYFYDPDVLCHKHPNDRPANASKANRLQGLYKADLSDDSPASQKAYRTFFHHDEVNFNYYLRAAFVNRCSGISVSNTISSIMNSVPSPFLSISLKTIFPGNHLPCTFLKSDSSVIFKSLPLFA